METSGGNPDPYRSSSIGGGSRRHGLQFSSNFFQSPLSAILEYSGILRARPSHQESEGLIDGRIGGVAHEHALSRGENSSVSSSGGGEVSIRIIGAAEQEHLRSGLAIGQVREVDSGESGVSESQIGGPAGHGSDRYAVGGSNGAIGEGAASSSSPSLASEENSPSRNSDGEAGNGGGNNRDSSYQRYDIQQVARWVEQVLPFSALLLVVFIRQHLQGFFVTIWIAAVMFKSNDILRKQTALKGERKIPFLVAITLFFMLHVVGVYWWYRNDDLLYPLIILPPKAIPPFWHAIFIIMVNDTMVRQAGMVVKSILLMYYKNSRGRNYRKQVTYGDIVMFVTTIILAALIFANLKKSCFTIYLKGQMLTLVEYLLLLYRALLPTPVWYRFFLNKEYGSLFSSLTTGLYLTFKLTSLVEKIQCFFTALKALSRKDVHYGSYATPEQVIAAGDLCAICQEKMHAPILLRCKHIFCEDCVSEWFERERTCPLCRALVKPADLRSFGDGSTSLFFQLF